MLFTGAPLGACATFFLELRLLVELAAIQRVVFLVTTCVSRTPQTKNFDHNPCYIPLSRTYQGHPHSWTFTSATLKCVLGGELDQTRLPQRVQNLFRMGVSCLFRTYTLPIGWIRPRLLPRPQFVLLGMTEFQLQQSGHTLVGIFSVFDSTTASLHFVALRLSGIWTVSFRLSAFGVSAPSLAGAHHDTADRHGPASESVFSRDS
ncbi:hypothetical protein BDQ17DRAFT_1434780 [Cyathus striatus]|nr:hypothetical protein BDQ17DRAFT_1434780 [Cyathus striatus]